MRDVRSPLSTSALSGSCVAPVADLACQRTMLQECPYKGYLHILREITGVRTSTPTAILLAELGLLALSDEWLLRAAKFWNNLAALPSDNIYKCMALDSCKSAIGPRNRRKDWVHV